MGRQRGTPGFLTPQGIIMQISAARLPEELFCEAGLIMIAFRSDIDSPATDLLSESTQLKAHLSHRRV